VNAHLAESLALVFGIKLALRRNVKNKSEHPQLVSIPQESLAAVVGGTLAEELKKAKDLFGRDIGWRPPA
jgi:hypothetical protein